MIDFEKVRSNGHRRGDLSLEMCSISPVSQAGSSNRLMIVSSVTARLRTIDRIRRSTLGHLIQHATNRMNGRGPLEDGNGVSRHVEYINKKKEQSTEMNVCCRSKAEAAYVNPRSALHPGSLPSSTSSTLNMSDLPPHFPPIVQLSSFSILPSF